MKQQYLILGAGKFGLSIAMQLQALDQEVMVVDRDPKVIARVANDIKFALEGDATQEAMLQEIGARNFDVVIVSIGDDIQASIMTTILLKELGCKHIICKAESDLHAKVLEKIGANRVVIPEQAMGRRIAHNLVNKNILDFINLSDKYAIVEMPVRPEWIGKSVIDLALRQNHGLNIVGLKRGSIFSINISPDLVLQANDIILVIGENDSIERVGQSD